MLRTTILRNRVGAQIGTLETRHSITILRDRFGFQVGTYDERSEITRDRLGRVVGAGANLLTTLLTERQLSR